MSVWVEEARLQSEELCEDTLKPIGFCKILRHSSANRRDSNLLLETCQRQLTTIVMSVAGEEDQSDINQSNAS